MGPTIRMDLESLELVSHSPLFHLHQHCKPSLGSESLNTSQWLSYGFPWEFVSFREIFPRGFKVPRSSQGPLQKLRPSLSSLNGLEFGLIGCRRALEIRCPCCGHSSLTIIRYPASLFPRWSSQSTTVGLVSATVFANLPPFSPCRCASL